MIHESIPCLRSWGQAGPPALHLYEVIREAQPCVLACARRACDMVHACTPNCEGEGRASLGMLYMMGIPWHSRSNIMPPRRPSGPGVCAALTIEHDVTVPALCSLVYLGGRSELYPVYPGGQVPPLLRPRVRPAAQPHPRRRQNGECAPPECVAPYRVRYPLYPA